MTILLFAVALLVAFLNHPSTAASGSKLPFAAQVSPAQGMLSEDKYRLGSAPPSCHNRCDECKPCAAVQAPTLPGREQVPTASSGTRASPAAEETPFRKYANYKPVGWKCRCGDRLFNP